jgi:hypothetical protein
MSLTQLRVESILNSQPNSLRKVYSAVPIAEPWSMSKIFGELERLGTPINYAALRGHLGYLVELGVVIEHSKNEFIRVKVKQKIEEPRMPSNAGITISVAPRTPIERLTALSVRCAEMAETMKKLSSDIADATLDVEEQINTTNQSAQKLKQLQALLKGLDA